MELAAMERVRAEATIENPGDLVEVERGLRAPVDMRRIVVKDALADAGTTTLALPTRLVQQLGLAKSYEKRGTSGVGTKSVSVPSAVCLAIPGRFFSVAGMEVPDDVPVFIGQIPLEMLDRTSDLQGRRFIGNPAHGHEHVLELY
ncbi:MAG TPA: hypothetical protein VKU02_01625 [Gemmataceae bacterium]|nr:hypothetical protein [Gemmataceae bacterium]